jgi:hypothetical protein
VIIPEAKLKRTGLLVGTKSTKLVGDFNGTIFFKDVRYKICLFNLQK